MKRLFGWLVALWALLRGRRKQAPAEERDEPERERIVPAGEPERERIVPAGEPDRRAEGVVMGLLAVSVLFSAGFVVAHQISGLGNRTQLLGVAIGGALACVALALLVIGERLIVTEEIQEEYPEEEHPEDQQAVTQIVEQSGSRFTRKRLLIAASGAAVGALGIASITPALSLGPLLDTDPLYRTPWRRGRGLVDTNHVPLRADDIEEDTFYTAYPELATEEERDQVGAPLVVVRLAPDQLRLPRERAGWAPQGIVAFSKVCTHAACAVSLYRKPTFAPAEPRRALVCPCHYSTFDPAAGGKVIYGPAGRPLPQLPLMVDLTGVLRAGGNFSGPVGPGWEGVRGQGAS